MSTLIGTGTFMGALSCTSDTNLIYNIARDRTNRILFVGDPLGCQKIIEQCGMILASPIVPEYNTLFYLINGDYQMFHQMYFAQLHQKSAEEFFATMLRVININENVVIFIPDSCKDIGYIQYLLLYIQNVFGITAQTKSTKCVYNPAFNNANLALMYLNGCITSQEFLYFYNGDLDYNIFNELVNDLRPVVSNPNDANDYLKYFEEYQKIMRSQGEVMEAPMRIESNSIPTKMINLPKENK